MIQLMTDVTALSSRDQVVLPKSIRESLRIDAGLETYAYLVIGNNILLKPIKQPDMSEFTELMDGAKEWAESVGMTEDDINDAIKSVRKNRRVNA